MDKSVHVRETTVRMKTVKNKSIIITKNDLFSRLGPSNSIITESSKLKMGPVLWTGSLQLDDNESLETKRPVVWTGSLLLENIEHDA